MLQSTSVIDSDYTYSYTDCVNYMTNNYITDHIVQHNAFYRFCCLHFTVHQRFAL